VRWRARTALAWVAAAVASGCGTPEGDGPGPGDIEPGAPYAVAVAALRLGEGGGRGQDRLPDVVLGPPRGAGLRMGSTDTLSLGRGGSITVELGVPVVDGPGVDLLVFENPFLVGGNPRTPYAEPAIVEVSDDGVTWHAFPCAHEDYPTLPGCAGVRPVLANADDPSIDPRDPEAAGGDAFDLATVGVARARLVRITDVGGGRADGAGTDGFDLDAVAVVHGEGLGPRAAGPGE
jgi:hypothetical protein